MVVVLSHYMLEIICCAAVVDTGEFFRFFNMRVLLIHTRESVNSAPSLNPYGFTADPKGKSHSWVNERCCR